MTFPTSRLRRLRSSASLRELVCDVRVDPADLVCPIFIDGAGKNTIVESMPGISRIAPNEIINEVTKIRDLGIRGVMLFGVPSSKDDKGSGAYADDGIVQKAIQDIRSSFGDSVAVMADVCLCQYTSSGHCGLVTENNTIDNDSSIKVLASTAISQARAGVDVVSPSAMMDGQVSAIRTALDDDGFQNVAIMSHSAKHASSFYAPFRDAAACAPQFGDRKSYQVPYTSTRASIQEVASDIEEGVDIVMIKPALAYLDIIAESRRRFDVPIAAYSVSGEYALVKKAASEGMVNGDAITHEILTSIKRAGADIIVTYFAKEAAAAMRDCR